jgi:serine protease Do
MSEQASFPRRFFFLTLVSSVLISSVFGFIAGIISADGTVRDQLISAVSPVLKPHTSVAQKTAADVAAAATTANVAPFPPTEEQRRIAAVQKVSPAVVSIIISKDMPTYEEYYSNPFSGDSSSGGAADGSNGSANGGSSTDPNSGANDFFQQFFANNPGIQVPQYRQNGTQNQEIGAGSGFIVSPDGYIVTNKHVVADTTADYTVVTQSGDKYTAKVLARDPVNDIAVIKIEKKAGDKDFPYVEFGDSSHLKVGQSVVAIGYALGQFTNSVSGGIVSGLQRSIQAGDDTGGDEQLYDVIQTDAAINPGNSGGPLLDLNGKAIGVDVAIVQGSENIGFALPINDVKNAVESVQKGGTITRAYLGVRYVMIDQDIKDKNQLPVDNGALIVRGQDDTELAVAPGSPADLAGLVENDIILEAGGKVLTQDLPLAAVMSTYDVGDKVTFKVLHKGVTKTMTITLGELK